MPQTPAPDSSALTAEQLRRVLEVSRLLAVTPDLDALLTRIATSATSLLHAERASIFLHDPVRHELWTRVALGAKEIRVPDTAGIVGHVFHSNAILHVPRPYEDGRFNREIDKRSGFVTRNLLTTPARDMERRPIGVLQVVNHVGGDFDSADRALVEMLAEEAGVAIQRHYLHQEVVRTAGLRHEMDLAQKLQRAMIPESPPQIPGLQCAGWMRPASATGGDTYDLWDMGGSRLGIFLGDASGHGIAPAIVVLQARSLTRALADLNCDPQWLLDHINARLAADLEPGRFVTTFVGCIDSAGDLRWSSAGHGPIFFRASRSARFESLEPTAPPIGIVPELNGDPPHTARLESGGMLVVTTDGIFESRNPDGELYGVQRLVQLLDDNGDRPPAEIIEQIRQSVLAWQKHDEPADDQTIAIVKRA